MLDQEKCNLVERKVAEVKTEVELIDFCQILGADIDRARNKKRGVSPFEIYPSTKEKVPHLKSFTPTKAKMMDISMPALL